MRRTRRRTLLLPEEQGLVKGASDELMNKPRWAARDHFIRRAAGEPGFSAILLHHRLLCGDPAFRIPAYQDKPVQVTGLPANFSAAKAGLKPGDKIVALDGEKNPNGNKPRKVIAESNTGQ